MRIGSLLVLAASLASAGCGASYWDVLSFKGDRELTAVPGSYKAYAVYPSAAGAVPQAATSDPAEARAQRQCSQAFAGLAGGTQVADPMVLTGIVAGYAVGAVFDLLIDHVKAEADRIEKESQQTTVMNINVPDFDFRGNANQSTCIFIERTAKLKGKEESVFRFATVVQRVGDLMYAWAPTGATMSHAAALSEKGKSVRVEVAIATTTAIEHEGRPLAVTAGPSNFSLSVTPSGEVDNPGASRVPAAAAAIPLPVLKPASARATTVSIAVTESGSASGMFKKAYEAAEDNLKALRTFGVDYATASGRAGHLSGGT